MTPFWIEFCFWGFGIWLFLLTTLVAAFFSTTVKGWGEDAGRHHSLKNAYEQHREANRKALQKLRKRVKILEMERPTLVNFTDNKEDIIKWEDLASASSEDCAISKSAS